jgi:hypothetical protein
MLTFHSARWAIARGVLGVDIGAGGVEDDGRALLLGE